MGKPSVWATVGFVTLAVAVLLSLGTWQVTRLLDAADTRDRFESRINEPPIVWPPDRTIATDDLTFRRVDASGVWDFEHSQFITARIRYGLLGEEIVTPLLPTGGGPALLINRGWYPIEQRDAVLRDLATETDAHVQGLLRESAEGSTVRTADGAWRWFDITGIAAELPYPVEPYRFVAGRLATDAEQTTILSRDLPVQLYTGYIDDTPHLEYALTWFGLAGALIATVIIRVRSERRPPKPKPLPPQETSEAR